MKKIVLTVLSICLCVSVLASCKGGGYYGLGKMDIKKVVTLGDYKNITVNTNSEDFIKLFDLVQNSDAQIVGAYEKSESGKLQNGDVANIDYEGKLNGIAFEGGTAQGYDLTLGSGSFIDGFEDGLIGVEVGQTVDLHLTFPKNYDNTDLAGQAVIFTVKVNYRQIPKTYDKFYSDAGFKSAEEYKKDINERVAKTVMYDLLIKKSKFNTVPQDETFRAAVLMNYYNQSFIENYNMSIEDYLKKAGISMKEYAENVNSQITMQDIIQNEGLVNLLNKYLVSYALFDDAKLSLEEDIDGENDIEKAYFECKAVSEKVTNYLYKSVKIK